MARQTTIFMEFIGSPQTIQVWDYILTEGELEFSFTDLAAGTRIDRITLNLIWDKFLDDKLVLPARKVGRTRLYKLNTKNPKVKKFMELSDLLIIDAIKKYSTNTQKALDISKLKDAKFTITKNAFKPKVAHCFKCKIKMRNTSKGKFKCPKCGKKSQWLILPKKRRR